MTSLTTKDKVLVAPTRTRSGTVSKTPRAVRRKQTTLKTVVPTLASTEVGFPFLAYRREGWVVEYSRKANFEKYFIFHYALHTQTKNAILNQEQHQNLHVIALAMSKILFVRKTAIPKLTTKKNTNRAATMAAAAPTRRTQTAGARRDHRERREANTEPSHTGGDSWRGGMFSESQRK